MSAPTFNITETNGAGPTGTSTTITQISFASVDLASTGASSAANPVPQNQNSFEKWLRLQIATVATNAISGVTVFFNGTAPTDSAAVGTTISRFFGLNAAYATPVATTSTIATLNCTTQVTAPGPAVTNFASNTANLYTGYVTMQYRLGAAAGGNAILANPEITFQYVWS